MEQKDRIYSLIIGTEADAIEVNNLHIKFKVDKTSDNKNKKNSATVEIYNLSEDRRARLEEDYVRVHLAVNYAQAGRQGLVSLFSGQVTNIRTSKLSSFLTKRQGTDLVTVLEVDELFEQLNTKILNGFVPSGQTVGDVIKSVVKDIPEVSQRQINGRGVGTVLPSGYPLSGTPKQVLDRLSRDYDIEWQIDQGVLYVADTQGTFSDDTSNVFSFGQMSGLVEAPEFINEDAKRLRRSAQGKTPNQKAPAKNAIKFKVLLNPTIVAGSIVYLDFHPQSGYYKVDEVSHSGEYRGNEWYSTIRCTEKL